MLGQGISLLQKFSNIFGNEARCTENDVTSDKSQFSNIKKLRYFLRYVRYELVT